MSVTIDDWCIGWWRKALLAVEAVDFVIGAGTYVEGGLILGHPTRCSQSPPHCCQGRSFLPRLLPIATNWSFAKEDFDLKLKLPFFETLLLLFSPSVSPLPLIVLLTCHLSGSPGDFRCLKKIFEDVQDTGGLSHLEGPLFSWCKDPFIDATFLIRHRRLTPLPSHFPCHHCQFSSAHHIPPLPPLSLTRYPMPVDWADPPPHCFLYATGPFLHIPTATTVFVTRLPPLFAMIFSLLFLRPLLHV